MKRILPAALLALTLAGPGLAQNTNAAPGSPAPAMGSPPPPPQGTFQENCGADVQKLCPTAQKGKEQHRCLHKNAAAVSTTCSSFMARARAQHQQKLQQQQQSDLQNI